MDETKTRKEQQMKNQTGILEFVANTTMIFTDISRKV